MTPPLPVDAQTILRAIQGSWEVVYFLIWVGVVGFGLKWLRPGFLRLLALIERLHDVIDAVHGTPEERDGSGAITRQAEPGMRTQFATITERLDGIAHEVKPNSGTSAHDAVMKGQKEIRAMVADALRHLAEVDGKVSRLDHDVRQLEADHPDYPPKA